VNCGTGPSNGGCSKVLAFRPDSQQLLIASQNAGQIRMELGRRIGARGVASSKITFEQTREDSFCFAMYDAEASGSSLPSPKPGRWRMTSDYYLIGWNAKRILPDPNDGWDLSRPIRSIDLFFSFRVQSFVRLRKSVPCRRHNGPFPGGARGGGKPSPLPRYRFRPKIHVSISAGRIGN